MTPLVSIVIPTLNEAKYIAPLIASIKAQDFPDFEVVIIDKSSDSTPTICKKAGFRVFTQTTPGIAAARAQGFAAARGKYIASTDADSQLPSDWLTQILTAFINPKVVCVYGPAFFPPTSKNSFANAAVEPLIRLGQLFGRDFVMGMNFAVRTSAYHQVGGFNPALKTAEDSDLGQRMRKVGNVLYASHIRVTSSDRRFVNYGPLKFLAHHARNAILLPLTGTASSRFEAIR